MPGRARKSASYLSFNFNVAALGICGMTFKEKVRLNKCLKRPLCIPSRGKRWLSRQILSQHPGLPAGLNNGENELKVNTLCGGHSAEWTLRCPHCPECPHHSAGCSLSSPAAACLCRRTSCCRIKARRWPLSQGNCTLAPRVSRLSAPRATQQR